MGPAKVVRKVMGGPASKPEGRMRAVWNDAVLAESEETIVVEGNHYFPPGSLDRRYFEGNEQTSVCPWKGTAAYFDVVVAGERNPAAAWTYPEPKKAAADIADHVAFWHGVQVEPVG